MHLYNGRESFYQWDIDQKITADFAVGDEIHFYNLKQGSALVTLAYDLNGKVVADVPNILLQSSHPLTVYRYITDEFGKCTVDECTFNVHQRAKPDEYFYTETELYTVTTAVNKALEDAKASGEFDGVSVAHSWDGTVLTVSSASGTSSADLKGEKGDKGEQGIQGVQGIQGIQGEKGDSGKDGYTPIKGVDYFDGSNGYTPIKGVDYWTAEDISEIKGYVDDAILGGAW